MYENRSFFSYISCAKFKFIIQQYKYNWLLAQCCLSEMEIFLPRNENIIFHLRILITLLQLFKFNFSKREYF